MMHQSNPGVRRLRHCHPSIHFPRTVYSPSRQTGALAFVRFSFGAKKSSLANSTAPPSFSEARSISSVNSIATKRHKRHKKKTSSQNILSDIEFWTTEVNQQPMLNFRCP